MDLHTIAERAHVEAYRLRSIQLETAVAISVMALGNEDDVKRLLSEFGIEAATEDVVAAKSTEDEWRAGKAKMAQMFGLTPPVKPQS